LIANATVSSVALVKDRRRPTSQKGALAWQVDRDSPILLHDQVAALIRRAIADGERSVGDHLPQAKDLAAVLAVNTNTVLRALRILRDEGLLQFRRGRGIVVSGTVEQSEVVMKVHELVEFAHQRGYRDEELVALISGPAKELQ
jgi:GntR family transcriptional regulator